MSHTSYLAERENICAPAVGNDFQGASRHPEETLFTDTLQVLVRNYKCGLWRCYCCLSDSYYFGILLVSYFFAALQIFDNNQRVCDVTVELLVPDLGYVSNVLTFGHLLPTSNLSFFHALIL